MLSFRKSGATRTTHDPKDFRYCPMTASTKAIFLSYASEDAEAARCICEALTAAGLAVWQLK